MQILNSFSYLSFLRALVKKGISAEVFGLLKSVGFMSISNICTKFGKIVFYSILSQCVTSLPVRGLLRPLVCREGEGQFSPGHLCWTLPCTAGGAPMAVLDCRAASWAPPALRVMENYAVCKGSASAMFEITFLSSKVNWNLQTFLAARKRGRCHQKMMLVGRLPGAVSGR